MPSEFAFDVDHIEQVTARARGFQEFVVDQLEYLDSRVHELVRSGRWTGSNSVAYAEEHRNWIAALGRCWTDWR